MTKETKAFITCLHCGKENNKEGIIDGIKEFCSTECSNEYDKKADNEKNT